MKEDYQPVTEKIWDSLKKEKWTHDLIEKLKDTNLFKYSPFKSLTDEQYLALEKIKGKINTENKIILNGQAGTGKTILLIKLFVELILDENCDNIAFIVPNTELLKIVKKL